MRSSLPCVHGRHLSPEEGRLAVLARTCEDVRMHPRPSGVHEILAAQAAHAVESARPPVAEA